MREFRFRSSVVNGIAAPVSPVDYRAGIIRGVSAMQAVEALGHGVMCDQTTLEQVRDQINGADGGVKSRFSHPGACEDATGKMLGRAKNARIDGDKVLVDLHLAQSAKLSPNGNLHEYVMRRAQEDPASFGMSVVVSGGASWKLADGSEVATTDDEGAPVKRPKTALGKLPFLRPKKTSAVDVVDEPAANRDGLFSDTTSALSDEAFHTIDAYAQANGLDTQRLFSFASRYFAARGHQFNPPVPPAQTPKGTSMDPKAFAALAALHKDHAPLLIAMFGEGKSESEMLAAIEKAQISTLTAKMGDLVAKAEKERADNAAQLQASKDQLSKATADLALATAKVVELEKFKALGAGAPAPVGGVASDELASGSADPEQIWATDAKTRALFFNDKEAFVALHKLSFASLTGEGGPVSLTPKAGASVTPINSKTIAKEG